MIRLHNLERSYPLAKGKFFYVLRDIDIEVAEGEFVSVMGPSGAGLFRWRVPSVVEGIEIGDGRATVRTR